MKKQENMDTEWLRSRGYKTLQAARIIGRRKQHVMAVVAGKRHSATLLRLLSLLPQRTMPEPETPETYRAARAEYVQNLTAAGLLHADRQHRDRLVATATVERSEA